MHSMKVQIVVSKIYNQGLRKIDVLIEAIVFICEKFISILIMNQIHLFISPLLPII